MSEEEKDIRRQDDYMDSEEEMYWDCYDENDEDLLTYWNIDELVVRDEMERLFYLIKQHVSKTILPLFDRLTIEGLKDFLYKKDE